MLKTCHLWTNQSPDLMRLDWAWDDKGDILADLAGGKSFFLPFYGLLWLFELQKPAARQKRLTARKGQ